MLQKSPTISSLVMLLCVESPLAGCSEHTGNASGDVTHGVPTSAPVPGAGGASTSVSGAVAGGGSSTKPTAPIDASATGQTADHVAHDASAGPMTPDGAADASTMDLRCVADSSSAQTIDYAVQGPFAVGTMDITFEDKSRPIVATSRHSSAPSRTLVTTIYYPASGPAPLFGQAPLAKGGPFPMLMYSHGYSSSRSEAGPVANRAASLGYVVVAPDFPLTNLLANGANPDPTDAVNQPGDVSFLIDRLLELSHDPQHVLWNAVDETRIGAVGVSLGGLTTLLVGFHPKLADERITALVPIAPLSSFFMQGFYHTREIPSLLIQGDLDALIDYDLDGRRSFERAAPNARLITLAQGTHSAFAVQFDAATIAAFNALLGPPGSDPSNPDAFSCGAVASRLADIGVPLTDPLGGAANFVDYDPVHEPIAPCTGDEYKHPAMDPKLQVDLTVRGVTAFFDSVFGSTPQARYQGCRYLLRELPKNAAVELE